MSDTRQERRRRMAALADESRVMAGEVSARREARLAQALADAEPGPVVTVDEAAEALGED